jgi:nitric oxide dioxygenase
MLPEDIKLIQKSWIKVVDRANEAGRLFYKRLFEVRPDLRALFKREIEEQGRKLMDVLNWVVVNLPDTQAVLEAARALARRHVDYGVREEQYQVVGETLLWTLREMSGEDWTPQVEEAWTKAYAILAQTMVEEHRKVLQSQQSLEKKLSETLSFVVSSHPRLLGAVVATTDGLTVAHSSSTDQSDKLSAVVAAALALGKRMCEVIQAGSMEEAAVTGTELELFVRSAGPKAAVGVTFRPGEGQGLAYLIVRQAANRVQEALQSLG